MEVYGTMSRTTSSRDLNFLTIEMMRMMAMGTKMETVVFERHVKSLLVTATSRNTMETSWLKPRIFLPCTKLILDRRQLPHLSLIQMCYLKSAKQKPRLMKNWKTMVYAVVVQ